MLSARTRRATAAGTTALTALLTAGLTALPAHAATGTLTAQAMSSLALPTDGQSTDLEVFVGEQGTSSGTTITVTADLDALAGVAEFGDPQSGCTTQGHLMTCTQGVGPTTVSLRTMPFKAAPGAKLGASGVLHGTVTAADGATKTFDSTLMVGGSKLQLAHTSDQNDVKPGSTVTKGFTITNSGQLATQQTVLVVNPSVGLQFQQHFANCEYGTVDTSNSMEGIVPTMAICTIDSGIAPGETAHVDPMTFGVSSSALYEFAGVQVFPGRQNLDLAQATQHYTFVQGSGPRLTLGKPESGAPSGAPVADLSRNAFDQFYVKAQNTADFVALGGWKPQAGGKEGTLEVGLRNDGPASVWMQSGDSAADVQVALPVGVTVAKAPAACLVQNVADSGGVTVYSCGTGPQQVTGAKLVFDFTLRVDDPTAVRTAKVTFRDDNTPASLTSSATLKFDPNPANNAADVALGLQPASPSPRASTAPAAAASPATATTPTPATPAPAKAAGATQDLAFTGGGSDSGTIAAAGAGVIVLGAGALLYANRRRKAAAHH